MKFWRTTELQQLRQLAGQEDAYQIARRLGRTPRAVQDMAKAIGLPTPPVPKSNVWPPAIRRRARQLRRQGFSLRQISHATGVPFGTLRHWIYDMPNTVHPNDQIYALERAIAACEAANEPSYVINDLRRLRDAARSDAHSGTTGQEKAPPVC